MGKVFYAVAVVLFLIGTADYTVFLVKHPDSYLFGLIGLTAWYISASGFGIFGLLRERESNPVSNAAVPQEAGYGGFWKRVVALIVDSIILAVLGGIIGFITGLVVGGVAGSQGADAEVINKASTGSGALIGFIINWLYFVTLESSTKQATFGKKAMGLIVTDVNGLPISFARANGRYWGKFLSVIPLGLGYAMVAFQGQKRGLHDLVAGTVIRKI